MASSSFSLGFPLCYRSCSFLIFFTSPATYTSLPNIQPYQTLGPSSTGQHLWYRRLTVAARPCVLRPREKHTIKFTATAKAVQSDNNDLPTHQALVTHFRHSHTRHLSLSSERHHLTGVCTAAAARGVNAERLSASPSWRSPRNKTRPFELLQDCNGHAARVTRIVLPFRRKRCFSIFSLASLPPSSPFLCFFRQASSFRPPHSTCAGR